MAICKWCEQEMTNDGTCCIPNLPIDGSEVGKSRVKYGDEAEDWGAQSGINCHDCNCRPGDYHHVGCDVERCYSCGGQFISCEC